MPAISSATKNVDTLELFAASPPTQTPPENSIDKPVDEQKMEERKKLLNKEPDTKTYSRNEAVEASLEYFKGDELAANVWINKYALKDSAGNLYEKSPAQMHQRLAKELARVENKYPNPLSEEEIYGLLENFKYLIPQGGPMSGIGNNHQYVSLSNCFVIGPGDKSDSYGAILLTDEEQVQLMKRRGGVGHDLTHIRPKGTSVMNSALTSTGIVPFMERYSNTTREVAQDGRRGALMLSISVNHPDAESFIDAKQDKTKVTGANVSVKISDEFMNAVETGTDFIQKFPVNSSDPLIEQSTDAKGLWGKIVHNAWKSAEPGVLFWDTIIKESIPDCYSDLGFETISTNPCGEIPLCPYDSCRLLAINLYSYVDQPFTEQATFNFDKFKSHVRIAQRMMDNIVDLEAEKIDSILTKIKNDPEPDEIKHSEQKLWEKIKKKTLQGRRTGLGITAEGDMLAALGITYGTDEATSFAENVQKSLALAAYASSVEMAGERGAFTIFDAQREVNNPFINRIKEADPALYHAMVAKGRRNIALLTIAPTGTTSLMTQTSSGLEPVFQVSYKRRKKVNPTDKDVNVSFTDDTGDAWEEYFVVHHKFKTWLEKKGYSEDQIASFTDAEMNKLVETSPYFKATANDIDWIKKVQMQGKVQKWVDHSISVTVNVPKETPESVIHSIYMEGWKQGCKGMTVYRDGSRDGVLISKEAKTVEPDEFTETAAPKRPRILEAKIIRFNNNHEKWLAVVGMLNNKPYEIFTGKAEDAFHLPTYVSTGEVIKNLNDNNTKRYDFRYKDKDGFNVTIEGLSRSFTTEFWNYAKLISGMLRHGMPLKYAISLVNNLHLNDDSLNTWKNGVVRALSKMLPDGTKPKNTTCTECGEDSLFYEEGCLNCKNCGYSKCG
ncbi:MAG: adenosylcobalamin-dependent ribonucleoside-diphosphate reductase [Cyclobacteriaceae bacterium]|nr:adenosylcobalamin-dependent ribonucleoside-diphosphate reductase [Cyclobacteriaceae bacterium]